MEFSQDHSNATYQIQSVSQGKIVISGQTYTNSVIVSADTLISPWKPTSTDTLTDEDLMVLLTLRPEIILLGTGEKSIILPAKKLARLLEKNFHVECMNTKAASHTYTILIAEKRAVVAGLII